MVTEFRSATDFVVAALNGMPGVSCLAVDGTFYALPNFRGVIDASPTEQRPGFGRFLLKDAEVAMVPDRPSVLGRLSASFTTSMKERQTGHGAYCPLVEKS